MVLTRVLPSIRIISSISHYDERVPPCPSPSCPEPGIVWAFRFPPGDPGSPGPCLQRKGSCPGSPNCPTSYIACTSVFSRLLPRPWDVCGKRMNEMAKITGRTMNRIEFPRKNLIDASIIYDPSIIHQMAHLSRGVILRDIRNNKG